MQPEEAAALGQLKAADLRATGAAIVASANIGCSLQIRSHLQDGDETQPALVRHPIQLLAESSSLCHA